MIKSDAAAKQLDQWNEVEDDDFPLQHLHSQLKKLPKKLREISFGLYGCNREGELDWEDDTDKFATEQTTAFKKLSKADRSKVLRVLFGKLTPHVEATLDWLAKKQQSHGFELPPFRGTRSKETTSATQAVFVTTLFELSRYHEQLSVNWLAAWAPHLSSWGRYDEAFGCLFAAVIDKGGKAGNEVFDILCQSARKQHDIGGMGAHVSNGLLWCKREAGWELMEKMLLAAQRQEGLRQVLLQSMRFAHPDAFQRMLKVILDNDLTRFSSAVTEMNQLFSTMWSAKGQRKVREMLETVSECLQSAAAARKALSGDDPERAFFALWSIAFEDEAASIKAAQKLSKHAEAEFRYVAAEHLANVDATEAEQIRIPLSRDEDLRVALSAVNADAQPYYTYYDESTKESSSIDAKWFAAVEDLLARMPAKPKKLKPIVWPWCVITADRSNLAWQLMSRLGSHSPLKLLPHLSAFDKYGRVQIAHQVVAQKKWDKRTRELVLDFAGDSAGDVREVALDALSERKINSDEAQRLEGYLTRTAASLRIRIVQILQSLADKEALAAAERLLQRTKNQRLAGLELLRQMCDDDRARERCVEIAKEFQETQRKVLKDEQIQLDAILASDGEKLTLDNCLGLMDLSKRSPVAPPKKKKVQAVTATTTKLVKAVDDWVHANSKREITYTFYGREYAEVLGTIQYGFPYPTAEKPIKDQLSQLPILEELQQWYENLSASLKDKDGLGLVRAFMWCRIATDYSAEELRQWGKSKANKPVVDFILGKGKAPTLRYDFIDDLLHWLLRINLPETTLSFCYDVVETIYAMVPQKELETLLPSEEEDDEDEYDCWSQWRNVSGIGDWRSIADMICNYPEVKVDKSVATQRWQLLHWIDEPIPGARRKRPGIAELADAYSRKQANLADVYDDLIGPRESSDGWRGGFSSLNHVTARVLPKGLRQFAAQKPIAKAVSDITSRVLEIELARGEARTVSTSAALAVDCYRGADILVKLLMALGKKGFKKHNSWRTNIEDNRQSTFTEMAGNTHPADTDTPASFSKLMKNAIKQEHFPEERLLQLAFLAPQWTEHIEHTLKWGGFTEGLYWFIAHMKYVWGMDDAFATDEDLEEDDAEEDDDDYDKPEKLSSWERIIRERTPLTDEQRGDGAIDVAWFQRTYKQLGVQRWKAMATAAKYAANSAQAKRAQLIADVLIGDATKKELVEGITKRNLKENVRLLGLLPLPKAASKADKDVQDRYEVLQTYLRYANQLSSMSRPEALRAYEIGMQNLASTAGYADPMRLQWAMEAASTKDLADGPIIVKKGDVSLTLELDDQAQPSLTVRRGEKQLKSLPKAVNKDKKFVELRERNKHLKRQASRVKQSLEAAMCRGDGFTGGELMQLSDHAILWPQLERIVLIGDGILGYPDKRGKALRDYAGNLEPVKKSEELRIAHPFDLLKSKQWSKWQHECFVTERIQPFKQMFRELYVVTAQEKKDKTHSNRYAGQQVNPRQAYALWGRRGWSVDEDENVWKAFHHEGINVSVQFDFGYTTPLEVEGLTIDKIQFSRRGEYQPIKLVDVPARLFSEVMRDMDLVVSVAHVGDVDPEASASTVEMRASLLSETCKLLNLKNVKLKKNHAVIKGSLSDYTVHLGSGVVHQMPGSSVCLVPVHSQHRGRLFLPFADDDPRTAEVVAKTLLLARDEEIDDPILLQQIRDA